MIEFFKNYPLEFCKSKGDYLDLHSPNDLACLAKIQYANHSDIELLLEKIPHSFLLAKKLKAHERSVILKKAASKIREHSSNLSLLISIEGGKPLKDALIEVERAAVTLETCAEECLRLSGEMIPMERSPSGAGHLSYTKREPIGPVLAISAFNHPLNLLAHQVGTAIASGCSVVIKPAPATPLCAYQFKNILEESGLPKNILFIVTTDVPGIEQLISSSAFRYISFVGSSKIGWNLRKIIAPGVRLALEHGGVAPSIVRSDADIEEASKLLCKSSFYHAGQVCISTQRIFIHEDRFLDFKNLFLKETLKLKTGDARNRETDVGPLIRKSEITRLKSWIEEAKKLGASIEIFGEISGEFDQFFSPTVLTQVPRSALLMSEEAFGPVVCLNSYSDEEELLNYLNSSPYIFESSIFTKDLSAALRLSDQMPSMTVVINNHNAFRVDWMPFGGHYLSGLGMGGVKYAMEEMTCLKQVIIKY